MVAISNSGLLNGIKPPKLMSGKNLFPPHLSPAFSASATHVTVTLTANRYYIVPFYIPDLPITFSGVKFYNTGTGDNAKNVRVAFYNESPSGGPGTLAKDFGASTLTGAAAIRTLASSWTPSAPGWYYGTIVSDSNPVLAAAVADNSLSGAGIIQPNYAANKMGGFVADLYGISGTNGADYSGDYVSGTYANFPEATSLTPTNSLFGDGGKVPAFSLYV